MPAVQFLNIYRADGQLQFQEENPKKRSGEAYARYEKYKVARTVREFYDISQTLGSFAFRDFRRDLSQGYVKYTDPPRKGDNLAVGSDAGTRPGEPEAGTAVADANDSAARSGASRPSKRSLSMELAVAGSGTDPSTGKACDVRATQTQFLSAYPADGQLQFQEENPKKQSGEAYARYENLKGDNLAVGPDAGTRPGEPEAGTAVAGANDSAARSGTSRPSKTSVSMELAGSGTDPSTGKACDVGATQTHFLKLYRADGQLQFQEKNPKKRSGEAYARYEKYKVARTVREFYDISQTLGSFAFRDFRRDLTQGYVKYTDPPRKGDNLAVGSDAGTRPGEPEAGTAVADANDSAARSGTLRPSKRSVSMELAGSGTDPSTGKACDVRATAEEAASAIAKRLRIETPGTSSTDASSRQSTQVSTDEDSLFSLVADQLSHETPGPEPKEPRETKPRQTKLEFKAQEARVRKQKRGFSNELVRDLVPEYIEGQPDPSVSDDTVKKAASYVSESEPLVPQNRTKFIWVVQQPNEFFSHDSNMAGPVYGISSRCAVCGLACSSKARGGLFRVRCYARRGKRNLPECQRPRNMRAEGYYVGRKCMEGLLGTPSVTTKGVQQLRERLRQGLEARDFSLEQWAAAIGRIGQDHEVPFRELLGGELRRLARTRTSDEPTDRLQESLTMADLQTFEARERHRQWHLDKLALRQH